MEFRTVVRRNVLAMPILIMINKRHNFVILYLLFSKLYLETKSVNQRRTLKKEDLVIVTEIIENSKIQSIYGSKDAIREGEHCEMHVIGLRSYLLYCCGGSTRMEWNDPQRLLSQEDLGPRIELFVPEVPIKSFSEHDCFSTPSRNFIIQGETLEFYVIVRLGELFNPQLKLSSTSGRGKGSGYRTKKMPSPHLRTEGTVQKKEDENSGTEAEDRGSSVEEDEETNRPVIPPGPRIDRESLFKVPQFREQIVRMYSNLEIRIEFMRANSKWKLGNFGKTTNSQLSKASPVSTDEVNHLFQKDLPSEASNLPLMTLPNGDIVYRMETDVCMKKRHLGQQILLAAILLPPLPERKIKDLLSPNYVEQRSPMRMVTYALRLVLPLQVNFEVNKISSTNFVSVVMENGHKEPVTIHSAEVVVQEIRVDVKEGETPQKYRDFFDITFDTEDFPVVLRENERYNFVVSIEHQPVTSQVYDGKNLGSVPEAHITWSTPSLCGRIISPYKLPAPVPPKKKLFITFDTESSPIKLHTIFPISITVTNLSKEARNIAVEFPLPELDKERDRFLFAPKKSEIEEKLINTKLGQTPLLATQFTSSKKERRASLPSGRPLSPKGYQRRNSVKDTDAEITEEKILTKSVYTHTSELLNRYAQSKKKSATIFCLEKVISIGIVDAKSSVKATLECIAMAEGLFSLMDIKVVDHTRKVTYLVQEPCEIYVVK